MIKSVWKYRLALVVPLIAVSVGPIGPIPTAAAVDYTDGAASVSQALTLINQERVRAGCASLWVVPKLRTPAERQSRDQAGRDGFGHGGANGSTVDSRLGGLGYSRWGENVAQSQSAHGAVNFWSNSSRHRANMLNCVFRETGLAVARSHSGKLYWTQAFGG
ncbi:MAG: CAP domain-containing protein [Pseudonocardiaceae bacterium]